MIFTHAHPLHHTHLQPLDCKIFAMMMDYELGSNQCSVMMTSGYVDSINASVLGTSSILLDSLLFNSKVVVGSHIFDLTD